MTATVREILFPSDLAPESDLALEHARSLAGHFGARLTLYHAVEVPDPRFPQWVGAHAHELWERVEEQARAALEKRAAAVPGPHAVLVERTSSASRALVQLVRRTHPDLTIMATHGREGLRRLLLGSVTEKVVQQVFQPVLCLREPDGGGSFPYRRILIPSDLSLASRLAFPMGAFFARAFGAEILAVHVVPEAARGFSDRHPVLLPSEASLWKFFHADFDGLSVTAQVHTGSVWDRIVHVAEIERADLIVMSTRGHDSLADRMLGSNTERVLRHAPCPVLAA